MKGRGATSTAILRRAHNMHTLGAFPNTYKGNVRYKMPFKTHVYSMQHVLLLRMCTVVVLLLPPQFYHVFIGNSVLRHGDIIDVILTFDFLM